MALRTDPDQTIVTEGAEAATSIAVKRTAPANEIAERWMVSNRSDIVRKSLTFGLSGPPGCRCQGPCMARANSRGWPKTAKNLLRPEHTGNFRQQSAVHLATLSFEPPACSGPGAAFTR